jgi:hypothetical protein
LVVGNNFNATILLNTNTRVSSSQIDTNNYERKTKGLDRRFKALLAVVGEGGGSLVLLLYDLPAPYDSASSAAKATGAATNKAHTRANSARSTVFLCDMVCKEYKEEEEEVNLKLKPLTKAHVFYIYI